MSALLQIRFRRMLTVRTTMKRVAASWVEPYSPKTASATLYIWQRNRSVSWHRLMQQRAKKGFVRHYVRGL